MEIGDWPSAGELAPIYREIRRLGLEQNVAELNTFGFTVLEPGRAAPVEWVERLRDRVLDVAERRTGVKHDLETGAHGVAPGQRFPAKNKQLMLYMLLEDPIFQEALLNPYLLALQSYQLGFGAKLSTMLAHVTWQDADVDLAMHTDNPSTRGGPEDTTATSTWALTDFSRDNGALAVVPGSHLERRRPNAALKEGDINAIPVETPAGSLIVWNNNLWHGAFPRKVPGLQLKLNIYMVRPYMLPVEDYRASVSEAVLASNPERLRTLLGVGSELPFTSA